MPRPPTPQRWCSRAHRYDYALSETFQGKEGIWTLTRCCQTALQQRWRGYAPPASCTIAALPPEVSGEGKNPFATTSIAIVPTMRQPEDVSWHKDLVYNSMWSLLVEIAHWNNAGAGARIEKVLMTGFATGTGKVSTEKCAQQMMLAVRHFVQGVPDHADWAEVSPIVKEVQETLDL